MKNVVAEELTVVAYLKLVFPQTAQKYFKCSHLSLCVSITGILVHLVQQKLSM
jgi:hypothetical protein